MRPTSAALAPPPLPHRQVANDNALTVKLVADAPGIGRAGDRVTFSLAPADVTISEEMDTMMAGYSPVGFRADEACPIMLVGKDTNQFRVFGLNNAFRPVEVLSSMQADIPEVDPDSSLDTYLVQERALGGFIPAITEINADEGAGLYDVRAAVGRRISWALALDRELRVFGSSGLLATAANWNAANRFTIAGGGTEWNAQTTGDPIKDIFDVVEVSAQPCTDIWLSPPVAHHFIRSQSVRDHLRTMLGDGAPGAETAAATAAQANMDFRIPGLPPFHIVAGKVLNESTGALEFILNDTVVITGNPPGGTPLTGEEIMTCKTFRRRGPSGTGFTTREFPLERRGLHGGMFMASGHAEQVKMVANNVGGIIINTIQ